VIIPLFLWKKSLHFIPHANLHYLSHYTFTLKLRYAKPKTAIPTKLSSFCNFLQAILPVKKTLALFLLLNCSCNLILAEQIPPDQKYDPVIEAKMNKWSLEVDNPTNRPIYEILRLIDSLDDSNYYYKEKLYSWLGTIYNNINQADKSAKYYYKELSISQEHKYNLGIANAYFNLGNNYMQCGQYKKAEQFYQQALYFIKLVDGPNNSFIISSSIELSKAEFFQKIYYKAEQRLLDLLKLKDTSAMVKINNSLNINIALSELYLGKNDLKKAVVYSKEALKLKDSTKEVYLKMLVFQNVRNVLMRQNKWEEALIAVHDEEQFLKENHIDNNKTNTLTKKARILEALGNREDELLSVYKEMFRFREKVKIPFVLSNVMSYEMDYEINQLNKQKEMELLLEKNEKRVLRLQAYLYLALALILIITMLGLIVWNRNRNKITNLKIEKEIDEKQLAYEKLHLNNASLTEFALHTERIQDKLTELKNKVAEALSTQFDKEKLHQIKNEINLELQNPALSPIELNHKVKSIKDELLFKLSRAHPSLTEKDRRLCILLMLNLSSKEMANILNIQEESVEKSRSRLRKKMNLSSNQNFIEYFNSIK
jgi:DNA-binding CsgD family transcriptional regulator